MGEIIRVSSIEVAEMMNTEHKTLLRKIDRINLLMGTDNEELWIRDTFVNRGKKYRCYMISKQGCEVIIQHSRKTPKLQKLIEYIGEIENPVLLISRGEHIFKQFLKGIFLEKEIKEQYQVLNYKIDYFIPKLNLIIEYDEAHHKYNEMKDLNRMNEIITELYKGNDDYLKRMEKEDVFKVVRVIEGEEHYAINEIMIYLWDNDLMYSTN